MRQLRTKKNLKRQIFKQFRVNKSTVCTRLQETGMTKCEIIQKGKTNDLIETKIINKINDVRKRMK